MIHLLYSPEELSCDNVTSQKKQLLQERVADHDDVHTGNTLRSCSGPKDSDEPQFSTMILKGWSRALLTEVASFCQHQVRGFYTNTRSFHCTYQKLGVGGKASTGISEYLVCYKLVLCPVLSVATYHGVAGTGVPAEGGSGVFYPVGSVRIFQHDDCGCQSR